MVVCLCMCRKLLGCKHFKWRITWYVNYMSIKLLSELQTRSGYGSGCLCLIIDHSCEGRNTMLMNQFLRGSWAPSEWQWKPSLRITSMREEKVGVGFSEYIAPNTSSLPTWRPTKLLQPGKAQTGRDRDIDKCKGRQVFQMGSRAHRHYGPYRPGWLSGHARPWQCLFTGVPKPALSSCSKGDKLYLWPHEGHRRGDELSRLVYQWIEDECPQCIHVLWTSVLSMIISLLDGCLTEE